MAKPRRNKVAGRPQGFRRGEIESHHQNLQGQFSDILAEQVQIEEPEKWWRRADQEIIAFDLIGQVSGRAELARRKDRGWHPVVPVQVRENWWGGCRAWVSWYEEWISHAATAFELRSVGLTVFWGPPEDKRQVIRAEWAEPPKHGGAAGQPHWHADFDQFVDGVFTDCDFEGLDSGFEELSFPPNTTRLGINLSGFHLAMAGWQRTEVNGNPWQASVGDDLSRLTNWGIVTLSYITTQLLACRRAEAIS